MYFLVEFILFLLFSSCLPFTVNVTLKNNGRRLYTVIKAVRFYEGIIDNVLSIKWHILSNMYFSSFVMKLQKQ